MGFLKIYLLISTILFMLFFVLTLNLWYRDFLLKILNIINFGNIKISILLIFTIPYFPFIYYILYLQNEIIHKQLLIIEYCSKNNKITDLYEKEILRNKFIEMFNYKNKITKLIIIFILKYDILYKYMLCHEIEHDFSNMLSIDMVREKRNIKLKKLLN
jgi:hypothetical protein